MDERVNHLEEVDDDVGSTYVFDVWINGWYLCVEGDFDFPEEMWLSGAWVPGDDPITKMFTDLIEDHVVGWGDFPLVEGVRELVLNAPVHEWRMLP